MAYGTIAGVKKWIKGYDDLVANSDVTDAITLEFMVDADAEIDAMVAEIVGIGNIPLANPPDIVVAASNKMTACFVLKRIFIQKDPNESDWVGNLCDEARTAIEALEDNPEILNVGGTVQEDQIESTTEDQDRIFSVETTSGGVDTTGDFGGTMKDW